MDKKFEDKIAKMAFGELTEAEAREVRAHAAANADAAKALASYEAIRSDLRRMRDVPPDQLSKERLQNAILTQGLKPKPVRRSYPWAWASSAVMVAGALAFLFLAKTPNTSVKGRERVVLNEHPSIEAPSILGPGDNMLLQQPLHGFGSEDLMSSPAPTTKPEAVNPAVVAVNDQPLVIFKRRLNRSSGRRYHVESDRGSSRPPATTETSNTNLVAKTAAKKQQSLVLIQTGKDNNTGASNAIEVQQTQDVIVSS